MEWVVSGSGLRKSMKSGGSWLFQKSIFCAETAFRDKMFWQQCPIWEKFFPPALEVFFSKKTFYKLHNLSFHYFLPKQQYLVITIHGIIPPEQCVCVCVCVCVCGSVETSRIFFGHVNFPEMNGGISAYGYGRTKSNNHKEEGSYH